MILLIIEVMSSLLQFVYQNLYIICATCATWPYIIWRLIHRVVQKLHDRYVECLPVVFSFYNILFDNGLKYDRIILDIIEGRNERLIQSL